MKKNILRGIFIILLLGTFYIIFGFSNQNSEESGNLSKEVTKVVAEKIPSISRKSENEKKQILRIMENVIRKIAHFSIYTLVGLWTMSFLSTYNLSEKKRIVACILVGIIYASSDEIHQSFVPGRSAQITDVMIDTMGVMLGTLVVLLILKIYPKVQNKNVEKCRKLIEKNKE